MKYLKILAALVVIPLLGTPCFAESNPNKAEEDVSFSHLFVSARAGESYPWGQIQDAVDNSIYGGIGVRYTYWNDFDGIILMDYSYFTPATDNDIVYGVHQVIGALGLTYHNPIIRSLELGVGFLCSWTRADYDETHVDKHSFKKEMGGTLVDNETEFGWFALLNLPVWTTENFRAGLSAEWQELWTLPERSHMLTFGVFVERRIW